MVKKILPILFWLKCLPNFLKIKNFAFIYLTKKLLIENDRYLIRSYHVFMIRITKY